jgi:transcriptional regulator with XRE-family HTH domain
MRERSYKVDNEKLQLLSQIHRPAHIAKRLNISRQLWHRYKQGDTDIPESRLNAICAEFGLIKEEMIIA